MRSRLTLFPLSLALERDHLTLQGIDLEALAQDFGTPLYVYDVTTVEASLQRYTQALQRFYPAAAGITYAGKAYLSPRLLRWLAERKVWIDCSSAGEILLAARSGVTRHHILVHGVNKSPNDLRAAIAYAGTLVVDNPNELEHLAQVLAPGTQPPMLWLRFQPGVKAETHAHIQTGHEESKFGMRHDELLQAAEFCRRQGWPLNGLHFHIGSQLRQVEPIIQAIDEALDLAAELQLTEPWHFCPGGGWGVPYHEDDLPWPGVTEYVQAIAQAVLSETQRRALSLPYLHLEPGRSLIAQAAVAIYRVGTVKRRPGRTWLLVDGGLADNPRPALYGARYTALPLRAPQRPFEERVWIGGPYCESGDVLIEDLPFPRVEEGEYLAIPVSGAYQLSMASNYNGAYRPAVLWVENGRVSLMQEREREIWW